MKEYDIDTFNGEVFNRLKGGHPNSYTFTKSLSEWIVKDFAKLHNIPTAIAKPGIVMAPFKEPIELYVDGLTQGPPAIGASVGVALNRVIPARKTNVFPGIPVDICANEIIIVTAEAATVDVSKPELNAKPYGVYNTTSNTMTCETAIHMACRSALKYPSVKAIRPPTLVYFSSDELLYRIQVFIFELIFAAFFDLLFIFTGSKPKIMKIITKSHKTLKLLSFFLGQDWKVSGINCSLAFSSLSKEEQEIFYCDMSHVDWNDYFGKYWLGIRKWALQEDLDNLQEAKRRLQK
jgi:fatty acyl-CoA reductase